MWEISWLSVELLASEEGFASWSKVGEAFFLLGCGTVS